MKRAMFCWECLGKSGTTRVKTAVMAPARAPALIMALVARFHHRGGGGLALCAWRDDGLEGWLERLLLCLAMTSAPIRDLGDPLTGSLQCNRNLRIGLGIFHAVLVPSRPREPRRIE